MRLHRKHISMHGSNQILSRFVFLFLFFFCKIFQSKCKKTKKQTNKTRKRQWYTVGECGFDDPQYAEWDQQINDHFKD